VEVNLGLIVIYVLGAWKDVGIVGPFGFRRPLLFTAFPRLKDERAKEAFKRLKASK